jgi:scyllo-inositol 2-dehydrogenase (NADP+)
VTTEQSPASREQLNVALVGYGLAGSVFHAPLIASTPGLRVAAIVTANPERQAKAAQDFPGADIVPDAEAVWSDAKSYDLAVIATVNRAHVPQAVAALEAGLPVVVDKPVAASVAQAETILAASRRAGKLFTVFQNRRWDNDFLTLRTVLDGGLLGRITRFESRYERWRPKPKADAWRERGDPEEGGGLLLDLGSHVVDQALQLFGLPSEVYAEVERRRDGVAVDDDTFIALRFPSGVLAHLWVSAVAPLLGPRFRMLGLNGAYEKYGIDPQEDVLRVGGRPGDEGWGIEPSTLRGRLVTEVQGVHLDGQVETLPGAYEQFYARLRDALLNGGPPPVAPEDSINALRVIEAARASAETRAVVPLSW